MIFFNSKQLYITYFTLIIAINFTYSQYTPDEDFFTSYNTIASLDKEVIYLHLNKTDFLRGEQIGFKAYIADKHSGMPVLKTSNLYVQLVDENNKTIKEKLLQVKNGTAHGTFKVDKLLMSKNYIIKAFTNYSRNFEASNIFEQKIRVVAINDGPAITKENLEQELQVSFMPEGGHLVLNTKNSMGVSVKDNDGLGVSGVTVKILNEEHLAVETFQLNDKGLAKFFLTPRKEDALKLSINYKNKEYTFNLPEAKERGLAFILSSLKDSLSIDLNTNEISLPDLKLRAYKLAIHNGTELKLVRFPKFNTTSIVSKIAKNRLFEGMNILTVLDETDTPILERLYFNSTTSNIKSASLHTVTSTRDSLEIKLNYNNLKVGGDLSISILPEESIANNAYESIASFNLLSSYLRGAVENADDYFKEGTTVDEDLDLLLSIQGWSAYDWSKIKYFSPKPEFEFEKGISARIANGIKKVRNFYAYPNEGAELRRFRPDSINEVYAIDSLFPNKGDKLKISEIDGKGNFIQPFLYKKIKFYPLQIPSVETNGKALGYHRDIKIDEEVNETFKLTLPIDENTIALNEVVVTEDKIKDRRLKNLIDFSFGDVTVFNEKLRNENVDFFTFLRKQVGFKVITEGAGSSTILNTIPGLPLPTVYLDGIEIQSPRNGAFNNLGSLEGLFGAEIDYVEVNRFGVGEGARGGGGVIRVFTREGYDDYSDDNRSLKYLDFDYPLTFDRPDTYLVPYYSSYSNRQYLDYGVIGWFPTLSLNSKNEVKFTIPKTGLDHIRLYIQGLSENGDFISEERVISLKESY